MNVYVVAKAVHVTCVAISLSGFVARFSLALHRPDILRHRAIRVIPHVNDTLLLAAAIVMLSVAQWNILDMPWLVAKIAGLVVYIGCGLVALRLARTRRARTIAFAGALAAFGYVLSVALNKSVAGPFARLLG
ncbi:MAG: regulator SirB [Betaproteobacteria bacterium]|nr:regulator SirB [Betaproteobacteria bacterium]